MDERRRRSGSEPPGRTTSHDPGPGPDPGQPTVYQVRVEGHLDDRWADWDEGLTVTLDESGDTLLTVPIVDQAALHGLLRKLRDLGVRLVSINTASPGATGSSSRKENR
jgi:hypothetical protein